MLVCIMSCRGQCSCWCVLEQPQHVTVVEPYDDTFHCFVLNTSITILWLGSVLIFKIEG